MKNECRNVEVIRDADGNSIVMINDIIFKDRQVSWKDVELYLKRYIGEFYNIAEDKEVVFIGSAFPSEYSGSLYSKNLKGANAKAKANAAQGIPEIIEIAENKTFEENKKAKHNRDAKNGWYKYDSRFALPVYNNYGEIEHYNVYHARLIIRHSSNGKKYLYDIIEIKKETSKSCQA